MRILLAAWRRAAVLTAAIAGLGVAACDANFRDKTGTVYPEDDNRQQGGTLYSQSDSIFGGDGLNLFDEGEDPTGGGGGGTGIAVNSFLWRASLDTISFMPLASADPFGGVIITDWYSPPESRAERFKVNLYILGRDLRADGIRAAVFRQLREEGGTWVDVTVGPDTPLDIENAVLTRARQLRIAALQ